MISRTRLEKRINRKTSPALREVLISLKKKSKQEKDKKLMEIAELLSLPRKKLAKINLEKINKESKEGDTIVVPGKVLSKGQIDHKIKLVCFQASKATWEKVSSAKAEIMSFEEFLKKDLKDFKIIR